MANSKSTQRVIVLDNIAPEGLELLENAAGIEYEVRVGLSGEELQNALSEFDGAVCRSGVKITPESIEGNKRLKAIVRAGVGTDNIDKPAATRAGIVVMNTPTGNTVSTAEHTMALLIGLSRNLAPAHASLVAGNWDRKKFSGSELRGKTLGVVGLGRIGQTVAEKAQAFEMNIVGFDPFLSQAKAAERNIQLFDTVDSMLPQCDYLTVHTPLTPETKGLIGAQQIELLKPGARLVNCARGGIYEEAALIAGLKSGKLGGVALDVYENEPCTDSELFQLPNTLCTPHLGASTAEAQKQVAVEAVELLIGYLTKSEIKHAVNTIALDPTTMNRVRPYLEVAFRLGMFCAQWHDGPIDLCELDYQGEIANEDVRIMTAAFCAGLLNNALDDVNIVSSEAVCADRGINIIRQSSPNRDEYVSMISVRATTKDQTLDVSGTVFGKNWPRLVRLQGNQIEAFMDGNLLCFAHKDVPGIIAYVSNVLAEEKINIAQMAVGRTQSTPGGAAVGVLSLDSAPSEKSLERVTQDDNINRIRLVTLPTQDELPEWLS
jgi:D-3-phosphoglycerate dehydrogenase